MKGKKYFYNEDLRMDKNLLFSFYFMQKQGMGKKL